MNERSPGCFTSDCTEISNGINPNKIGVDYI